MLHCRIHLRSMPLCCSMPLFRFSLSDEVMLSDSSGNTALLLLAESLLAVLVTGSGTGGREPLLGLGAGEGGPFTLLVVAVGDGGVPVTVVVLLGLGALGGGWEAGFGAVGGGWEFVSFEIGLWAVGGVRGWTVAVGLGAVGCGVSGIWGAVDLGTGCGTGLVSPSGLGVVVVPLSSIIPAICTAVAISICSANGFGFGGYMSCRGAGVGWEGVEGVEGVGGELVGSGEVGRQGGGVSGRSGKK